MTYYVTITARRKDARRHIHERYSSLEDATKEFYDILSRGRYIVGLYTGDWKELKKGYKGEYKND